MLTLPSPWPTLPGAHRASATNSVLENALKTVAETEEVGAGITEELQRNREKIESAHQKVRDVDSLTGTARKLLRRMTARDKRQRYMTYGVLCFLFLAILIVLYITVFGSGGGGGPAPAPTPAPTASPTTTRGRLLQQQQGVAAAASLRGAAV